LKGISESLIKKRKEEKLIHTCLYKERISLCVITPGLTKFHRPFAFRKVKSKATGSKSDRTEMEFGSSPTMLAYPSNFVINDRGCKSKDTGMRIRNVNTLG
jgi:hypothetical protein